MCGLGGFVYGAVGLLRVRATFAPKGQRGCASGLERAHLIIDKRVRAAQRLWVCVLAQRCERAPALLAKLRGALTKRESGSLCERANRLLGANCQP